MTDLYRGILLLLQTKFSVLMAEIRTHIRSFNQASDNPDNWFDIGVMGFWNLILEIVFTLFGISCLILGIALTAILAIIFYPFHGLLTAMALLLRSTNDDNHLMQTTTTLDELTNNSSPVIIKTDKNRQ